MTSRRELESERLLSDRLSALKAEYEVELDEESLILFEYAPDEVEAMP